VGEELEELRKIKKILTLSQGDALENELSKIASTDERKKVWILIDGETLPDEIAKKVDNIKRRAVYTFINELEKSGWIENPSRKPPQKLVEYIPPSWLKLLE
jgi:hypothetical protein